MVQGCLELVLPPVHLAVLLFFIILFILFLFIIFVFKLHVKLLDLQRVLLRATVRPGWHAADTLDQRVSQRPHIVDHLEVLQLPAQDPLVELRGDRVPSASLAGDLLLGPDLLGELVQLLFVNVAASSGACRRENVVDDILVGLTMDGQQG